MIRICLLLTFLGSFPAVHAAGYDADLLKIYAKILPRLVIMSSQKERIRDNTIVLCLLYDKIDAAAADRLSELLGSGASERASGYRFRLIQKPFFEAAACRESQLVFLFNSDGTAVTNALAAVNAFPVITAAYDRSLLDRGADVSLYVGRNVVPYLNIETLKRKGIVFDPLLFRVSKIHKGKGGRP